jgi:bifunctional UDP-N-acetylglucosamine pyrophosphorylase/glucosamine-1-phosphate N-acetyltransferase
MVRPTELARRIWPSADALQANIADCIQNGRRMPNSIPDTLSIVILAAGKGSRMKSRLPKVLHRLAGRPMLGHVLTTAQTLKPRLTVVITGHGADEVEACMAQNFSEDWQQHRLRAVRQQPQLGTGHAVQQALPLLEDCTGTTLILYADVPLIAQATLNQLVQAAAPTAEAPHGRLAVLTMEWPDPSGYGRIVRDAQGCIQAIVEHKDATTAEQAIRETNTGLMALPTARLRHWLKHLSNANAQGEYYLTDIVAMAVAEGLPVNGVRLADGLQVAGVNSPAQLAALERAWQARRAEQLLEQGVRLADPARLDVRGDLQCGEDVEIDINCIFEGAVRLGNGVRIGAHCSIAHAEIADDVVIHPYTHINGEAAGVRIGPAALIGPYARLRPGAELGAQVHIGNFVEIKNSRLGDGAKANHLAYLGDAEVGAHVNFGAGSITANYDGSNKHRTVIEDEVHVGSNCVLVAPVTLGAGSTIGGGSTITKNTPAGSLSVARGRQVSIDNWTRPPKKKAS